MKSNTPLFRLEGGEFDKWQLWLKDESIQKSGTIKDRRNAFVIQEAERLGVDKLVLITAGSNGYSLALESKKSDIEVVAIVDRKINPHITTLLQKALHHVIEVNLTHKILRPEEVIAFAREREEEVIWEVTNGYEEGYRSIVQELRELNPDYIVLPVGSGGLYVGVIEAVNQLRMNTKVIGVGVQHTTDSFADKLFTPWTPYQRVINRYDEQGHSIIRLDELSIKRVWQRYKHVATMEPSSAVIFAALGQENLIAKGTKVVLLNSGKLKIDKQSKTA